ncbi:MAG: hypothetical protein WDO14_19325 [Bacteroidota bacterium]
MDLKCNTILNIATTEIYDLGEKFRWVAVRRTDERANKSFYDVYNYDGKFIKRVDYNQFAWFRDVPRYEFGIRNDSLRILDTKGNDVYSPPIMLNSDETILYQVDKKWGIKKITGEEVTKAVYDNEFVLEYGIALVERDGQRFYIDLQGREFRKHE